MFKNIYRKVKEKLTPGVDMKTLLDRKSVKVQKTAEVEADDYDNKLSWWYRFTFDNDATKRSFLDAISKYPDQGWDKWVDWFDDYSNLNGEICVEAKILVPPAEAARFRENFKTFYTRLVVQR